MSEPLRYRSPRALDLILEINQFLVENNLTKEAFRKVLNQFLPELRQIKDSHAGTVQFNRWMQPSKSDWPEPRGEIVLAMQAALDKLKNQKKQQ